MIIQKLLPLMVIYLSPIVSVYLAIKFDGKPFRRTIEIEDVVSDTVLTSKLPPIKFRSLKSFPECGFGRR